MLHWKSMLHRTLQHDMDRIKPEPGTGPSTSTPSPLPSPLPTGNYTDYLLKSTPSSSRTGWRYNVMKFKTLEDQAVDPTSDKFVRPVKLNRKDPRTVRRLTDADRERINKRALERAGVKAEGEGEDGEGAGAGAEGEEADNKGKKKEAKEEMDISLVGVGTSGVGPKVRNKKTMFKKKTKRVFVSSEEARRLKREEWMPWVLEDDEGDERWIGRLEGGAGESKTGSAAQQAAAARQAEADRNGTGNKGWRPAAAPVEAGGGGSSYVAFVFGESGEEFQVVPVHRWYKFSQGPKYVTFGTEEAETEYERQQKATEDQRWIMKRRLGPSNSASGTSTPLPTGESSSSRSGPQVKRESSVPSAGTIRSRLLDNSVKASRTPDVAGAPKMKSVIGGGGRRSGDGQEQDFDEFDYEEDFQDDEEGIAKIDDLADEEETKELEERIKKEMRTAERPDEIPDEDQEEIDHLTGAGKEVKKLVKKSDKSGNYDSDDEENPYASSEYDEDDDDTASVTSQERNKDRDSSTRSSSQRPAGSSSHQRSNSTSNRPSSSSHSRHHSRSGSPSGSALVAKRATSPSGSVSGRKSTPGSRNGSPGPASGGKRKRADEDADGTKRRRAGSGSPGPSGGGAGGDLITEADLVALFKTKANNTITTKEVLAHFKRQLKAEAKNKTAIGSLLQTVANLVGKELVLKAGY